MKPVMIRFPLIRKIVVVFTVCALVAFSSVSCFADSKSDFDSDLWVGYPEDAVVSVIGDFTHIDFPVNYLKSGAVSSFVDSSVSPDPNNPNNVLVDNDANVLSSAYISFANTGNSYSYSKGEFTVTLTNQGAFTIPFTIKSGAVSFYIEGLPAPQSGMAHAFQYKSGSSYSGYSQFRTSSALLTRSGLSNTSASYYRISVARNSITSFPYTFKIRLMCASSSAFSSNFIPVGGRSVPKIEYYIATPSKILSNFGISNAAATADLVIHTPILLIAVLLGIALIAISLFQRFRGSR